MAFSSQLNQFPCKNFTVAQALLPLCSKPTTFFPLNPIGFGKLTEKSRALTGESKKSSPLYVVRAYVDDDEWGPVVVAEKEEEEKVVVEEKPSSELDKLKKALVDAFNGTDRGLKASTETRGKIAVLINELEMRNPTAVPSEAMHLLAGKWFLEYTSFAGLLSRGLPGVQVKAITQIVKPESSTTDTAVLFSGLLSRTSFFATVKYEFLGPKLLQVQFQDVSAPLLEDSPILPENVKVLGLSVDITPLKGWITSFRDTASSVVKTILNLSPVQLSFRNNPGTKSWSLTTYLDEDIRIGRGDGGGVFVLIKDGSPLLSSLA